MGFILRHIIKTAAIAGAAVGMERIADNNTKKHESELCLPYQLKVRNSSSSSKKIDVVAQNVEGAVVCKAKGGGFFAGLTEASIEGPSGSRIGKVRISQSNKVRYYVQIDGKTDMYVEYKIDKMVMGMVPVAKGYTLMPFGWDISYGKGFTSKMYVTRGLETLVMLDRGIEYGYVQAAHPEHLDIAFALYVCFMCLEEKPSKV